MSSLTNSIIALDTNDAVGLVTTGRLATFTFPEIEHNKLLAVAARFGIEDLEVPLTGWGVAMFRAVEDLCDGFRSGNYRWIARSLKANTAEVVEEVLIPLSDKASESHEVKGERRTIGRVTLTNADGIVTVTTSSEKLKQMLEDGVLARRLDFHRRNVPANLVGDWADKAVEQYLHGLPLDNRGHSFHVRSAFADAFDRFLAALVEAAGGHANKRVKVSVFRTVDNSPDTIASLVRSARTNMEAALDACMLAVEKATTRRGIEGAVNRLRNAKKALEGYKGLLGDEAEKLLSAVDKAALLVLGGEVALNFSALVDGV